MTSYRLPHGGAIDRARGISFVFDGRTLTGYAGDTVASALLANAVSIVGRSFKYHRPRGVFSAGAEEPNALVTLRTDGRREPNIPATMVELAEGLVVDSQNRWPSLSFDMMAVNGLFAPLFVAGFYYKTFMGPSQKVWMLYERLIRRAAGLGRAATQADPDRYEKVNAFCDVLVVGSGPAGLAAALTAVRSNAKVILADAEPHLGGSLQWSTAQIDGLSARMWCAARLQELARSGNAVLMPRTTVHGYFDGDTLAAVERVADHKPIPSPFEARQRHWTIRARRVVLATGAIERPIAFAGNDLPGVMLASAAKRYALEHAVAVGRSVVVFTTNDYGHRSACDLVKAGVNVVAIVDPREGSPEAPVAEAGALGIDMRWGTVVAEASGGRCVRKVRLASAAGHSDSRGAITCDALLVSGGWSPTVHLASQAGGPPRFDAEICAFVPGAAHRGWRAAGAANGAFLLERCLAEGAAAGHPDRGDRPVGVVGQIDHAEGSPHDTAHLFEVKGGRGKAFVDLQNDVTTRDLRLAHREGYVSPEHLKRYTTLGMATDQGKTSNLVALGIMAEISGVSISDVGSTRFRPPYTPVSLGALAGREIGHHLKPLRRTPLHDWHVAHGAAMVNVGLWQRPRAYLQAGEDVTAAYKREASNVRNAVGLMDVATLGKIDVQGPDAAEFLDRVYVNSFSKLPVGRARYGVMLREDGLVFDDGTTWRLSETRFLMTTTTANAGPVLQHLEFYLATIWPHLRVRVASVTDQWMSMAVAGPHARNTLGAASEIDMSMAAFPPMAVRYGKIAGVDLMACRLSFSGEVAYEVFCPAGFGVAVWEAILSAGRHYGIIPYGVEAMSALRIEKGHVASPELDGRITLSDINLERMSAKKAFIGRALMDRPALRDPLRKRLVGLIALTDAPVYGGAHLVASSNLRNPGRSLGHVTS